MPKLNTVKNYHLTAQFWSYTNITSADGTVTNRQYNFNRNIGVKAGTNLIGELLIYTSEKLQLGGQIKNLLDRNGEEVYVGGIWQITQNSPVINGLGNKEAYKYKAVLTAGSI